MQSVRLGVLGVCVALPLLVVDGRAQTRAPLQQGFLQAVAPGAATRGDVGASAGIILTRFDYDDYRGWGQDGTAATVGKRVIHGMRFLIQDQDGSTQEGFSVQGFGESTTTPDLPDPADHFLAGTQVQLPPAGAGVRAWDYQMQFKTPALADAGEDLFLGIGVDEQKLWYADGVSLHVNLGYFPNLAYFVYDLAGAGMPGTGPRSSYGVAWKLPITQNAPVAETTRIIQYYIDPWVSAPTGVATATTSQSSYTQSYAPPGTASFFSGLHPDAGTPPVHAFRSDDIGYRVVDPLLAGQPVAFFIAGDLGAEIPLGTDRGTFCVNPAILLLMGAQVASATGEAWFHFGLPAAIRKDLPPSIAWQAFGLDLVNLTITGTPCAKQRFRP